MLDELDSLLNNEKSDSSDEESFSPSIRRSMKKKVVSKHYSFLKLEEGIESFLNKVSMVRHVSFNEPRREEEGRRESWEQGRRRVSGGGRRKKEEGGGGGRRRDGGGRGEEEEEFCLRKVIARKGYYDDLEFVENEGYEKQFAEAQRSPERKRTHSFDSFFNIIASPDPQSNNTSRTKFFFNFR